MKAKDDTYRETALDIQVLLYEIVEIGKQRQRILDTTLSDENNEELLELYIEKKNKEVTVKHLKNKIKTLYK